MALSADHTIAVLPASMIMHLHRGQQESQEEQSPCLEIIDLGLHNNTPEMIVNSLL